MNIDNRIIVNINRMILCLIVLIVIVLLLIIINIQICMYINNNIYNQSIVYFLYSINIKQ